MRRFAFFLGLFFIGSYSPAWAQIETPESARKLPDGVYGVLRDGLSEKDVRPLKVGEVLVIQRQRFLKTEDKEPPRFVVVRSAPDVDLVLAGELKAVKEGEEVVRILLQLKPKAAAALERLTAERLGQQIAIILGGEVVTMHKIRQVIKGGHVQITSCAPGAANYLLEKLESHQKTR